MGNVHYKEWKLFTNGTKCARKIKSKLKDALTAIVCIKKISCSMELKKGEEALKILTQIVHFSIPFLE